MTVRDINAEDGQIVIRARYSTPWQYGSASHA